MTANDLAKLLGKWLFGLWMAGLGTYLLVAKVAVWPAIGLVAFGVFILNPGDLTRFALWFKENASAYLKGPTP